MISEKKLVSYVLQRDLGSNKAGDVLQMEEDEAAPLVESGVLSEATAEDVNQGDEEDPAVDEAVVNSLAKRLDKTIDERVETAAKKMMSEFAKANRNNARPVAAQLRNEIFEKPGDILRSMYLGEKLGHRDHKKKLEAYREDCRTKAILGVNETTNTSGG